MIQREKKERNKITREEVHGGKERARDRNKGRKNAKQKLNIIK